MTSIRDIAKLNGDLTYFTGKPCKRGHLSDRRVSNYICIQCAKDIYTVADRENYRTDNTLQRQFNTRRQSALRNDILFTIKFEDIEQPEYCPVLGIKLTYGWSGEGLRDDAKATIDKLVPALGYVPGNVFVISWRANKLKNDMTVVELENILRYMKERI